MNGSMLSWFGIVRLGLIQTGLGAIVVLTTSTLNRVMVIELAMPAILPGALVAIHYVLQVFRPAWGHGSDLGARRTPWIVGGMAVLATGGLMASIATAWMTTQPLFGIALAVVAFCLIGAGVGAAGTSLLVLLAKRTDDNRRAAAATIVWVMMIAGFIVTTVVAGHWLDPFSPMRLIIVSGSVSVAAMVLTIIGVWGVEGGSVARAQLVSRSSTRQPSFRDAFMEVWHEPKSRRFAIFVFVSMLAYSAQDLILEPFAGAVFAFTPGETTKLSGVQHAGTLIGMALVPLIGAVYPRSRVNLQLWTVGGCLASAIALLCLAAAAIVGPSWPLRETVFMLGVTNGAYAVAAIGSMMVLISAGDEKREGVRMGLWGASQAFAFGIGGFLGTLASDIARYVLTSAALSYFAVFASEAGLFVIAAVMAVWVHRAPTKDATQQQVFNLPIATVTEGARS
ncbi:BCD family MFS transporter [Bradyrhizobium viridifuturi]|jgi:MFS transporter, BCD family, chlorophyll transporter|nr:BCD family MFS transporter [Bradyrhizobium viridifuturi]ERF83839.1 MAG: MFS transporter, BCD family, chlorophyll transporter [Bradyrhizobium sp. DFCI-1]MCA3796759.1 BCD family MFS transporter [Burkholderia sp.]OYU63378.1 MAG: MFS transporter [Bradyrhizobium sp. PARBB1]PSO14290.1 MFS transporter [Bradyrhizobium sp. MOS004]QRI71351.1 BCD family MFS transporter [Bradyrhizobium sp. PSBB068]HAQ83643.1 MFS transporter [Bradyrhizobium sp.]